MEARALLDAMVQCALAEGFVLRRLDVSDTEPPTRSGVARLRDRTILLLVASDALEDRIDVVASALAALGAAWLDSRFLAPSVRERIERRLPIDADSASARAAKRLVGTTGPGTGSGTG